MDKFNDTTLSTSPSASEEEDVPSFPKDFDLTLPSKVIQAITRVLAKNEKRKSYPKIVKKQSKLIFTSSTIPLISLSDYLVRIIQMTEIEESIVVSALVYIDRICKSKLVLIPQNIHKLLFTSIIVAIKYNQDCHFTNSYFALIGGIPLNELNRMEYEFLSLIAYDLFISDDFFKKYTDYITDLPVKEGQMMMNN